MTGFTGKLLAVFSLSNWLVQWLILSLLALLLYLPVIGNYFVNDDFIVLKKVCLDGQLNTDGFFRPLSDISIYANYLFSGLNALAYTITSIIVHAFNALLLFHICMRWHFSRDRDFRRVFAVITTLFFLTYPFHNEPVVWLLGRASLLASTFAFLALWIIAGSWSEGWKMLAVAICYFIAMTGYESVLVLPAIVFVWLLAEGFTLKDTRNYMVVFSLVLIAHFIIRVQVSGSATGEYGSRLFQWDIIESLGRAVKAAGRLLVPPVKNAVIFSILIAFGGLVIFTGIFIVWKRSAEDKYDKVQRFREKKYVREHLLAWLSMLFIAMIIPFIIGVSTNTSEGDRLLYFPSFFFCALIAFLLVTLFENFWCLLLAISIIVLNIIFLQQNNRNWNRASYTVTSLLGILKDKPEGKTYIVNMPDQIGGAFVFRVGFKEALIVNGIDTASVSVVNYAEMRQLEKLTATSHHQLGTGLFIPPGILIQRTGIAPAPSGNKYRAIYVNEFDKVIYWNKDRWVVLEGRFI